MSRTINDVQQEYANAAAALGQITFQIRESEAALDNLAQEAKKHGDKMRHLNREALRLQEKAQESKQEEVSNEEASKS